ncbi:hypothetical protein DVA67_005605 [Solirubrobacter sp. CPCC 204708]|uniref:Immunity protein 35 domain-containing protein n=1 Tax=Solirubrobacter deserti TaxID=2282478 RepID=A0ABT4RGR2_9ACTN|nr:hypothetical protein [Solirubrobacter deserti]MBE2315440.1 hypothetical protein [Solirubrobacter deserti]MDA0137718.1 hypothetical protein [Solirubrobacter deserti]
MLAERAPGYADAVIEALTAWRDRDRQRPVDALWLDNYSQHGPFAVIYVGFADRAERFPFYDAPGGAAPEWVRMDDDEGTLLRTGAPAVDDPNDTVGEAVGRLLLAHDWRGVLNTTRDFVVLVCEANDEDVEARLRRLNPPETVEQWLRRAPDGQR